MFSDLLPWQVSLWEQMVHNSHRAHAYLLHGNKGIGKHLLAERLAYYWLCLNPNHNQPCRQCKSCHLLSSSGAHPDIFHLIPQDSDFIKVDQVRELVNFVNQTPQLSTCKVVLIEPAEALNNNAANALLKSLEEPAGNTHIILVTHQVGQLLATIKSRCIQQLCPMPSKQQALSWMRQQLVAVDDEQLSLLWILSGGVPLYAVQLYQAGILEQRQQVVEDIKLLLKQQVAVTQVVEKWNDIPLLLLFDWFCGWLHHLLVYQLTQQEEYLVPADMEKVLKYLADKVPQEKLVSLQNELLHDRQKVVAKANLNRSLLLESVLIRWINLLATR